MANDQGYNSISGSFNVSADQNPNPAWTLLVTLTRDTSDGGSRFSGDWSVDQNSPDTRLALRTNSGTWKFTGWCDDNGDHNQVLLLPPDSTAPLVTLNEISTSFTYPWNCGSNFSGPGAISNGTQINYQIGVLCV